MLSDEHQRVGNAIQRNSQSSTVSSKHLFEPFELFPIFLKSRHGQSFLSPRARSPLLAWAVALQAQPPGARLYPAPWQSHNPPSQEKFSNWTIMSHSEQPACDYVPFGEGPNGNWEHPNMRRSDLVQHKEEKEDTRIGRTSQIVFGERQHLLRVLDSLEGTQLPIARMQQERRI